MIDRACISLNARCNLKCVYCHFSKKKNNSESLKNEFSKEEVLEFCKNLNEYIQLNKMSYFKLGIVGAGEPLLSFECIKTIVEYFKLSLSKNVIKMYVISNGTLLSKDIVKFFKDNEDIIELNISLDGDKDTNLKLRGSYPDFSEYKKTFGKMPKINAVVTKDIINNKQKVLSFFKSEKIEYINFSKVFGTKENNINITIQEYESFLNEAKNMGIISRQNNNEKKYDCAKYGRLCGVGRTNIFITKTGVYPCGRFMNHKDYLIGSWDDPFWIFEEKLKSYKPCKNGLCYYELNKVGE